jgi:hypothetical protein
VTKEPEKKEIAIRPPSPGTMQNNSGQWKPEQLDPELANLAMARLLVEKMGTPSIVNKQFIVRKAIFKALNHIPKKYEEITTEEDNAVVLKCINKGNPTGYDSTLRLLVYDYAEQGSVNIDGQYFEKAWQFLMKPKYVISGALGMPGQFEEDKGESIAGRIMNWFRGGKKNEQRPNNSN